MRSYHSHVQTLLSGPVQVLHRRPTFRASGIFPVLQKEGIQTRFLFMGYWMEKRQIKEVSCVSTLRDLKGEVLCRTSQVIRDTRSYRIEVSTLLELAGRNPQEEFEGSMELEFFSGVNIFFPYPACIVNYYGPGFSSVVHTAQRVYNDVEDFRENSEVTVPESGFNLYASQDLEPFLSIINGCEEQRDSVLDMEFFNAQGESFFHSHDLGRLRPYETRLIYPKRLCDLEGFLQGDVGAAKIRFAVNWIYPRLIAGNLQHSLNAVNITHSYYDCTDAETEGDYWMDPHPDWNGASLMVPCHLTGERFTTCYFYPILSPSTNLIDVELYNHQGYLLGRKKEALRLAAPMKTYQKISLKHLCKELHLPLENVHSARIIANPSEGSSIPARIKIALDMGLNHKALPCNICTNLHPFNIKAEAKPHCFRWGPLLADHQDSVVWFLNSSPQKDYQKSADVRVLFHREKDTELLERTFQLPPHGSHCIRLSEDPELRTFFQDRPGWYTATSSTPHLGTYYFVEHSSGIVGGDHGF